MRLQDLAQPPGRNETCAVGRSSLKVVNGRACSQGLARQLAVQANLNILGTRMLSIYQ